MATKTIRFSKSTETSLFDGADGLDLAKIDVSASITAFEEILTERIQQAYPDAEVSADYDRSNGYYAQGFGNPDDDDRGFQADIDVGYTCQCMAEALYEDGNLWMVDAK